MRQEAATKREEIKRMEEEAEHRRVMPVDDSKIVEQMFGYLPEGKQPTEDIEAGVCGARTYVYLQVHSHSLWTHWSPSRYGRM